MSGEIKQKWKKRIFSYLYDMKHSLDDPDINKKECMRVAQRIADDIELYALDLRTQLRHKDKLLKQKKEEVES